MPNLLYQAITLVFNALVAIFVVYYLFSLRSKEKDIDRREKKMGDDYRNVVDNGLTQERQILDNAVSQSNQMMQVATHQANQIISGSQYIAQNSKASIDNALQKLVVDVENVSQNSKIALDQALQKIVVDVHREAFDTGKEFSGNFDSALKHIAQTSLAGFQNVASELELDLQKQIREFRQTLLANIEKEVEVYKQNRIRRIDQASTVIVQKVAQDMLNKSLSLDDHEKILIDALEKAKHDGIFD